MGGQVRVRKSRIHGYGLFALRNLKCGEVIHYNPRRDRRGLPVRFGGYNHSCDPNTVLARMYEHGLDIVAVIYRDVPKGTELTVNYGTFKRHEKFKWKCNCPAH